MTRAALTKLLILVILAFIICLPEFFTLYKASKVNFLCLPFRPCEQGNQVKMGGNGKFGRLGKIGDAKIQGRCDLEKWEQACTQETESNTTDAEEDFRRSSVREEDPEKSWFMCKTDMDMAELHRNLSSSELNIHFEVSVELHLKDAETLNLTLYGLSNHRSLHLHPAEERYEDEEGKRREDERQRKAFYCCLPTSPASQSRCLLWFANQTVLTAAAQEKLPWTQKDEWRCMFRVLWLVLLCVVLLTVVTTVLRQIFRGRCSCKKPKVHPVGYNVTGQQFNDIEKHTDSINPKGMILHSSGSGSWSELTPIQEIDSQDDTETLLDGNVDQCYTANLHHRSHHAISSLYEEQDWWQRSRQRSTEMDQKSSGEK